MCSIIVYNQCDNEHNALERKKQRLKLLGKTMFNKAVATILPYLPKNLVWMFSKQYIAGETLEEALVNSRNLNSQGLMTTIDILGEFITSLAEAEANKTQYLAVIEAAEQAKIMGNYSIKPTFFGLLLDSDAAYHHIREVVAKAAQYNNFIRIDMEDSPCTDLEIDLYRRLQAEFPNNVGLVVQAYLKRTLDDIKSLLDIHSPQHPVNLRLCKGIYVEPEKIAYKKHDEINEHFLADLEFMLQQGMYPGIATHDKYLVDGACTLIEKYRTPRDHYEFQMLYGVTPALRQSIVDQGHRMRVYVPFGKQWFGYSTRRLKENPQMAGVIIKALFHKG
jgi:proline dehydrogenase